MSQSLRPLLERIDKVVVLTLESGVERQRKMEALLAELDLPFEFHYGRDCRHLSVEELTESGDYDPKGREAIGRPHLTAGEIGCALSHRDIAQRVGSMPGQRLLVLEDDARIVPESVDRLASDIATMPDNWNLAYFGHELMNLATPWQVRLKLMSYYPVAHLLGRRDKDPATIRRIYRRPLNARWMFAGWFNEAHAYAIDSQAATYLTNLQKQIWLEADLALNHLVRFSGLKAITQKQILFEQRRDVPSEIGGRPSWK